MSRGETEKKQENLMPKFRFPYGREGAKAGAGAGSQEPCPLRGFSGAGGPSVGFPEADTKWILRVICPRALPAGRFFRTALVAVRSARLSQACREPVSERSGKLVCAACLRRERRLSKILSVRGSSGEPGASPGGPPEEFIFSRKRYNRRRPNGRDRPAGLRHSADCSRRDTPRKRNGRISAP